MINIDLINTYKKELLDSSFFVTNTIKTKKDLEIFMKCHIFSVWDFMSLLKFLQNNITYNNVPWKPSKYSPNLVRYINEIVLWEESDLSLVEWEFLSHFQLYIKSMNELWIDTKDIEDIINNIWDINSFLNDIRIPLPSREFMKKTFSYIETGDLLKVAAAFTFWRENIIPEMFIKIVKNLEISSIEAPTLYFYFKRHIELDWDSHGPLSMKLLEELSLGNINNISIIENTAIDAINARKNFWEAVNKEIINNRI